MKLTSGIATLFLVAGLVSAIDEKYSCINNKCAARCNPTNDERDGEISVDHFEHGKPYCYLRKTGTRPGSEDKPITCLDGVGCSHPASGADCLTKDWNEEEGGCSL
ncbi:hypothetical protein BDW42DRAFT_190492 [Aspergillus taichungensis]|uniref:Uncharacterized protein n=1 Tax=Aspergillus taichungensis TaxID=482145 RepID=A0A2J5I7Z7_9EURO|nr:hypothetical protein BDW42DRAFT_190492 [Aspergillus taichungensis]